MCAVRRVWGGVRGRCWQIICLTCAWRCVCRETKCECLLAHLLKGYLSPLERSSVSNAWKLVRLKQCHLAFDSLKLEEGRFVEPVLPRTGSARELKIATLNSTCHVVCACVCERVFIAVSKCCECNQKWCSVLACNLFLSCIHRARNFSPRLPNQSYCTGQRGSWHEFGERRETQKMLN